jgi:psp operon transcriptional activator
MTTDVRVIAATNVDLPDMAERGEFRADLLDRLAFDVVTLPPLRGRPADILDLANAFGLAMAKALGLSLFPGFSKACEEKLLRHSWPGNVRELRNVVERAVYRAEGDGPIDAVALDPFESPWRIGGERTDGTVAVAREETALPKDFTAAVAGFERDLVRRAMDGARGNQSDAAQALGLGYHQFRRLLRKYAG